MKHKVLTGIICLFLITACTSEKQKLSENIKKLEKELKNDSTGVMNYKKASDVVKLYEDFATRYPDDTMSSKYLFRAADVAAHSHNVNHAIDLYKKVVEQYPQSKYVAQSWFYIGFLNENELKNVEEARRAYTTLLKNYPDYDQKETVQWLLNNLGKSDAEIVREFEAAQAQGDSIGGK